MPKDTQTATKKQSVLWTVPASWIGVRGGISDTSDGILAWGRGPDSEVSAARESWANKVRLSSSNCITLEQVHGQNVACVGRKHSGSSFLSHVSRIPSCDGQITSSPDVVLVTSHADCAPLYLYCSEPRAIGLVHAGWRGTLAGIASNAVEMMRKEFSASPSDIDVAIGPMITTRHYEVGDDVSRSFREKFGDGVVAQFDGKPHLDLYTCIVIDLMRAGVAMARSCPRPPDTFANPHWSSYRRDGESAGGMLAFFHML